MIFYAWCSGNWNKQDHSLEIGKPSTNFSTTQLAEDWLNYIIDPTADYLPEMHIECQISEKG